MRPALRLSAAGTSGQAPARRQIQARRGMVSRVWLSPIPRQPKLRLQLHAQLQPQPQPQLQPSSRLCCYSQSRSFTAVASNQANANTEQKGQSSQASEDKRAAQQNRHSIDRQSDEVSLSGTDDAVAAQKSVAFETTDSSSDSDVDQKRTQSGQQNSWSNPLDASPANRNLSAGTDEVESGSDKDTTATATGQSKGTSRSQSKLKQAEPGFEKKAFAGSTRTSKETQRAPVFRPGSR